MEMFLRVATTHNTQNTQITVAIAWACGSSGERV